MPPHRNITAIAWLIFLISNSAAGSKPRLRLEQIDTRSCATKNVVEAYVTELELEGNIRAFPTSQYRLFLQEKEQPQPPLQATTFAQKQGKELHLALVVENAPSYGKDLEAIKKGLAHFIHQLPQQSRLSVIIYANEVRRLLTAGSPHQAEVTIASMVDGAMEVDPALDEALTVALRSLGEPSFNRRRLIILISDGINRDAKRDIFRGIGNRARQLQIPLHPIGYSPMDERGPLLNLGEMAKRSGGTMRWAQTISNLGRELENLSQEISQQMVLTFAVPNACSHPQVMQVKRGSLLSNPVKAAAASPNTTASKGINWSVWALAGLFLLAITALFFVSRSLLSFPRKGHNQQILSRRDVSSGKKHKTRKPPPYLS